MLAISHLHCDAQAWAKDYSQTQSLTSCVDCCTLESEGLLEALGLHHPEEWTDSVMEEEEEEDQSGSNDDESDSGDGGGGGSSGRGGSSSSDNNHDGSDGGHGSGGHSNGGQEDDCPSTDEEHELVVVGNETNTHQAPRITVSPMLEAQLQAFTRFRTQAVNRQRKGKAVAAITAGDDRQHVIRFFAWLKHTRGIQTPTMNLFTSASMGGAVEAYIEERKLSRKDSTIAKEVASLVAASRFTHAMLRVKAAPGTVVSTAPLDESSSRCTCKCSARHVRRQSSVQLYLRSHGSTGKSASA